MQALGDRMKLNYEKRYKVGLTRRTPVIIRVDGRAFHTLTKGCERPFDSNLTEAMLCGVRRVLDHAQGAKLAYVQSDEASFLLTDYDSLASDAWFGYDLCKLVSISASLMTQGFNQFEWWGTRAPTREADFDSRAFNIPESEIANYFLWRAQDWARNSLTMYASTVYSHSQLFQKNRQEQHEMLWAKDKNWTLDLTPREKNGTFVMKVDGRWTETSTVLPVYRVIRDLVNGVLPTGETE